MSQSKANKGIAIALAWPQTYCKQPGAWYDPLMIKLGFNTKGYYQVGHAAIVLVDTNSGKCHYFDFGRYHAPYGHGRVRSETTDPELEIQTIAKIQKDKILNIDDILTELSKRKACHGEGKIMASYCSVDFTKALAKAQNMQAISPIKYGPFLPYGTNCSRFVHSVLQAGKPSLMKQIKLRTPLALTPTPLSNVKSLGNIFTIDNSENVTLPNNPYLDQVLAPNSIPLGIPKDACWMAGEGAGSWFHLNPASDDEYSVSRFDPNGVLEFQSWYRLDTTNGLPFPNARLEVLQSSNFQKIEFLQNGRKFTLIPFSKNEAFQTQHQTDTLSA